MRSYLSITINCLFFFKTFEERSVQKSAFQNYFKADQIVESGDYAKCCMENTEEV